MPESLHRMAIARRPSVPAPGADSVPPPPPLPRSLPVLRTPVAPDEVFAAVDRIRCGRLHAVLSGSACVKRQQAANGQRRYRRKTTRYEATAAHVATVLGCCRSCVDGREVAQRLGVTIQEARDPWG